MPPKAARYPSEQKSKIYLNIKVCQQRKLNLDRVKAVRGCNRRGLLILERILIFDEEGIPRVGGAPRIRLRRKFKSAQKRQSASRDNEIQPKQTTKKGDTPKDIPFQTLKLICFRNLRRFRKNPAKAGLKQGAEPVLNTGRPLSCSGLGQSVLRKDLP